MLGALRRLGLTPVHRRTFAPLLHSSTSQRVLANARTIHMASALIRLTEVKRRTGLGRSTIYMMMDTGQFPSSIKIGGRAVAWVEAEVDDWVKSRIVESRSAGADAVRV